MITVTDSAASAIRTLAGQTDTPEVTGVRISPATEGGGAAELALSVTEGPLPEDQVVESQGARLFVDSDVADSRGQSRGQGPGCADHRAGPGPVHAR